MDYIHYIVIAAYGNLEYFRYFFALGTVDIDKSVTDTNTIVLTKIDGLGCYVQHILVY